MSLKIRPFAGLPNPDPESEAIIRLASENIGSQLYS